MVSPNPKWKAFASVPYGVRAMASLLYHYIHSNGLNTIAKIINTYAPSGDGSNNPTSYANFVASNSGIGVNDPLGVVDFYSSVFGDANMLKIMREMIRIEMGQYISDDDLQTGFSMFQQSQGIS